MENIINFYPESEQEALRLKSNLICELENVEFPEVKFDVTTYPLGPKDISIDITFYPERSDLTSHLRHALDSHFRLKAAPLDDEPSPKKCWTRNFSSFSGAFSWSREFILRYLNDTHYYHLRIVNAPANGCKVTKEQVTVTRYRSDCGEPKGMQ